MRIMFKWLKPKPKPDPGDRTRAVALHERAELRADPFGDLRPRLPVGLDDLLDRAGDARPLALIGPGLAWLSRGGS
jgi:hypothetical protein